MEINHVDCAGVGRDLLAVGEVGGQLELIAIGCHIIIDGISLDSAGLVLKSQKGTKTGIIDLNCSVLGICEDHILHLRARYSRVESGRYSILKRLLDSEFECQFGIGGSIAGSYAHVA